MSRDRAKYLDTRRAHAAERELSGQQRVKTSKENADGAGQPVVFQILRDSQCSECGAELEQNSLLFMEAGRPLCLPCARFGDLEFLPAGDTALTRRATKYSERVAVVVRFSRSRKRYERQGILVEPGAVQRAEEECTEDAGQRAAARVRAAERRRDQDRELAARMAQEIRMLFPGCPMQEAAAIAEHTAVRGSGRVGRTDAGRALDETALTLAVVAAIRHKHTNYDELLFAGVDRADARERVALRVEEILDNWRG